MLMKILNMKQYIYKPVDNANTYILSYAHSWLVTVFMSV